MDTPLSGCLTDRPTTPLEGSAVNPRFTTQTPPAHLKAKLESLLFSHWPSISAPLERSLAVFPQSSWRTFPWTSLDVELATNPLQPTWSSQTLTFQLHSCASVASFMWLALPNKSFSLPAGYCELRGVYSRRVSSTATRHFRPVCAKLNWKMCDFSDCGINWTASGLCERNGGLPWARKFCTHCGLHSDECRLFTLTCYLHHHSGAAQRNRQVSFYLAHKWSFPKNWYWRRTYSLFIPERQIKLHALTISNTLLFWIHMRMHWGRGVEADGSTNTLHIARLTALQNLVIISVGSTLTLFIAGQTPLFQNYILLTWRVQRGKRKPKQRGIV